MRSMFEPRTAYALNYFTNIASATPREQIEAYTTSIDCMKKLGIPLESPEAKLIFEQIPICYENKKGRGEIKISPTACFIEAAWYILSGEMIDTSDTKFSDLWNGTEFIFSQTDSAIIPEGKFYRLVRADRIVDNVAVKVWSILKIAQPYDKESKYIPVGEVAYWTSSRPISDKSVLEHETLIITLELIDVVRSVPSTLRERRMDPHVN